MRLPCAHRAVKYQIALRLDKQRVRQIASLQGGRKLDALPVIALKRFVHREAGAVHQPTASASFPVFHLFRQHAVKEFLLLRRCLFLAQFHSPLAEHQLLAKG